MAIKDEKLLDLYRKSQKNKDELDRLFNPRHNCFSCLMISDLSLEDVCSLHRLNLEDLVQRLS